MTTTSSVSQGRQIVNWAWNALPAGVASFLERAASMTRIIATEAHATVTHVLPASIQWAWRKYACSSAITTIPIEYRSGNVTKTAYLNIHGAFPEIRKNQEVTPLLLMHGDHGHPYTMLQLADMAQKGGMLTFSLYIPGAHDNSLFEMNNALLGKAIDKIEELVKERGGRFAGVLGAGHSKGAILLAKRQFVDLDSRIIATCAIGGRLNAPDDNSCPDKDLRKVVRLIYQGIVRNPRLPLFQIIPKEDWNASQESMAVRPDEHCYNVPGMHLSGLYKKETRDRFFHFLEEHSLQTPKGKADLLSNPAYSIG